jgi:hypothetical protein
MPVMPSGREVLRGLQRFGAGIRSKDFYAMMRAASGTWNLLRRGRAPGYTSPLPDAELEEGFPGARRRYIYTFNIEQYNYNEDQWRSHWYRMTSSQNISGQAAERMFRKKWTDVFDPLNTKWDTLTWQSTRKRGDL